MNNRYAKLQTSRIFFVLLFLVIMGFNAQAQGDLLVYPKKLIFEGTEERVKILNFRNEGKDSATYKLSYIENRMNENGSLEIIEFPDEEQNFATPFLRFYPRSITLAPGETQTVKIQLTRTNALETGEYRSHLYIRAEEKTEALAEKSDSTEEPKGLSIKLTPIYGISIPNIIRIGNPGIRAEINNLDFKTENNSPILSMQVHRNGKRSVYGTLSATHVSPSGKETPVSSQSVVIYNPTKLQNIKMKLDPEAKVDYSSGTIILTYTDQEADKATLATASLNL